MQPLTRDPNKKHEKSELEILYEEALKEIKKYGTSEGALLGWDTRGRGRKDDEKEPKTRHTVADYKVVQHPKYKPEQLKTYDPKLSNISLRHFFGVADGHGQNGREVSTMIKEKLPSI